MSLNSQELSTPDVPNRLILESITDAFAALDFDWQFIYLNDKAAQIMGQTIDHMLGRTIWDLLPNQQQTPFDEFLRQVASTRKPGEIEAYLAPSGTWFNIRAYPADHGISIFALDITAQKRIEEALHRAEKRVHIALEAADMGTWEWNLQTNEVYWNEQHFRLFGMEPPHNGGSQKPIDPDEFMRHVHPDDRQRISDELKQTIEKKVVYNSEFRAVCDDGQVRWMSGYGRVTGEVNGKSTRLSGVMFDITDRRLVQEALVVSQERLQIVQDSITDHAIITIDTQAIITGWNPGAQQLFGSTASEAIGQSALLIFTPEDWAADVLKNEMSQARQYGRADDERYHRRKDGTLLFVSGVMSPLYDAAGQLLGYVKVARDLSERQRMEQALRESDRRKDEFLAMLAHELRNPLAPIRNVLQIMELTTQDNETLSSGVTLMSRQVDHLVRLIDDLLDVSRISRGQIELRTERLELTALVGHAAEAIRPFYNAHQRSLKLTLPATPIYVQGDATRLTQVVTNLLTNGVRYTRNEGQVWLRLEEVEGEARLLVGDDGIGLATDQLSRIFDLFVQVDTALNRSQGGLGLGLTLVEKLVKLHAGRVEARSEGLGLGSEFWVHLPLVQPLEKNVPLNFESATAQSPQTPQLLVVDDNHDAADTLAMLLKLKGHQVQTRYSGKAALEAIESIRPNVVLLDISMPELDGYQTCRLIRQQPWGRDLVLIALTGYGQNEDKRLSQEAGFNGHLVKPVDLKTLTELITELTA